MIEERVTISELAGGAGGGWESSASDRAMSAAREELAVVSAQVNDGHARLVALMRRVLGQELWCAAGFRSPEQWLTAYAGLTWSAAHDVVRIARRCPELPTMWRLLEEGRLTLGLAAVIAKYTPAAYDADVGEFASYTTVTQLRRVLCRYEFNADQPPAGPTHDPGAGHGDDPAAGHGDDPGAGHGDDPAAGSGDEPAAGDGVAGAAAGRDTGGAPGQAPAPDTAGATSEDTGDTREAAGAFLPGQAGADDDRVEAATDAATDAARAAAPDPFDPATAPPRLRMRYAAGRFHLAYDAPADIGALVEQALLEAKDTLFHLHTRTMTDPQPADPQPTGTTPAANAHTTAAPAGAGAGAFHAAPAAARPGTTGCRHDTNATGCGPKAGPGTAGGGVGVARSHAGASFGQALGLIAQRSLDIGAPLGHSRASRYRIYLHLDTEGHGWLHKQAALPPALRERILCDGVIQPVWETDGTPVNVGRAQRIVPARTRRLLEDRDRGCRFPGCLTLHHLECHHLDHWTHGGATNADRMIMLCPYHHDEHHRGAYLMVGDPTRPDGITFTTRDGTRLHPDYRPHPPETGRPHTDRGDTGRSGTGGTGGITSSEASNTGGSSGSDRSPADRTPYAGPANDALHLALVRFDPRPPRGSDRHQNTDDAPIGSDVDSP